MDVLLSPATIHFKPAAFLNMKFYLYCKISYDKTLLFEKGHISAREDGLSNGKAGCCLNALSAQSGFSEV